jgi:hypothetical protein
MFAESLEKFHAPIIPSRIFFPSPKRVEKKGASNVCIFSGSDQIKEQKVERDSSCCVKWKQV